MSKERKKAGRKQFLSDDTCVVGCKMNKEYKQEFKQLVLELRDKFLKEKSK